MYSCEGLGFKFLSQQEQQAYKIILKALSSNASSFDCSQINSGVDLMKVMHTVLGDNPSVIYFNKTEIEVERSVNERRIFLSGVHSKPQQEKMSISLDATLNRIITIVNNTSKDEHSKLIKLYELLQKNIRYNKDEIQFSAREISNNPASHNAYGALVNKLAVCDGFSSAFNLVAQKLGFECMLVVGKSAYATKLQDHAWNIVKVKNKYYHIDVTWDARKYNEFNEFSYAYFALTDDEIKNDHSWNKTATPDCSDMCFSYYSKNGLYASTTEQLKEIVKTQGKKNANIFRIKLSRNIKLPNNAGDYLVQMILNQVVKLGERKQASYNWNENTRCLFAKIL